MPSCRSCRAPLHGTEDFCPACGTPLRSRSSGREIPLQQPPGINPFPIIGIVIILGIIGIMCLKDSWIGQVLTHPYKEDPMSKISVLDARTTIENQIINGVTALGSKATFKYTVDEKPAQKSTPGPVQLKVDTSIKDANARKPIIDPIKEYFGPAKISTLIVNDAPRHRTWTYTAPIEPTGPAEPSDADLIPDNDSPSAKAQAQQQAQQAAQQQAQQQQQPAAQQQYQQQQQAPQAAQRAQQQAAPPAEQQPPATQEKDDRKRLENELGL